MKKMFLLLSLFVGVFVYSQNNQVDISKLSPELQEQIRAEQKRKNISNEIRQYGEWAGMGKEIGIAVKEGLSALTTEVDKVSKTDAGKLTMFIIAWKVIGSDLKTLVFGPILLILVTLIYFYLRKKWYGIKRITIKEPIKEGPFWNRRVVQPGEYTIYNPNTNDDDSFIAGKAFSSITYGGIMLVIILGILL